MIRRRKPIRRTSGPRRQRKGTVADEKREADRLARLICLVEHAQETGGTIHTPKNPLWLTHVTARCQGCSSWATLRWCHGFSRRYHGTRWEESNGFALCDRCHLRWSYNDSAWKDWMRQRLGEQEFERLRLLTLVPSRWDGTMLVALRIRAQELGIT